MKDAPIIIPTAVYTSETLKSVLGLRASTIAREIRLGRLQVSRRAGRYYVLGSWVLAWLVAGQVPVKASPSEEKLDA